MLSQHCSFIISNNNLKNLVSYFENILPKNKLDSCTFERILGLYFKKYIKIYFI